MYFYELLYNVHCMSLPNISKLCINEDQHKGENLALTYKKTKCLSQKLKNL